MTEALMYQTSDKPRWAQRIVDRPPAAAPSAAADQALSRVRKILTAYLVGMPVDAERLEKTLAVALPTATQELERLFALGFLRWLTNNLTGAAAVLGEAVNRAKQDRATAQLGETAYWRARVRIQLGRSDAVEEYGGVLRTLGGSPQATAWFVDLLWRAGRVDRAEQVWKSVKTNKRVTGCDEGPLLEARASLRRGEIPLAERILTEASPANGVVQVERLLLLAWIAVAQKQADKALGFVRQAEQGPYPSAALKEWRRAVESRLKGEAPALDSPNPAPSFLSELLRGHLARLAGRNEEAVAAYRDALAKPFAQPFARYGLASMNQEDFGALLGGQPGLFLALRCRARLAVERFCKRAISAAECLEALQLARKAGFQDVAAGHFQQLAQILQTKQPDREMLRKKVGDQALAGDVVRRNVFRAALELAATRLAAPQAQVLLQEWSQLGWVAADPDLSRLAGRQLLRLLLLGQGDADADALGAAEKLLAGDPVLSVGRALVDWPAIASDESMIGGDPQAPATARLLCAGAWLAGQAEHADGVALEQWREQVRGVRSQPRLRGLAVSLLVQEAAERGDASAVAALIDDLDCWRSFHSGPPRFVLAAVQNVVLAQPGNAVWRRCLLRWLQLWDLQVLGEPGGVLAGLVGLASSQASSADAPPGVPVAPWFLHRASRLVGQDDAEAFACVRRALAQEPDLLERPEGATVRDALPELERRVRAHALAEVLRRGEQVARPAVVLVDVADLLSAIPEGKAILAAAQRKDTSAAQSGLAALAERTDVPARLIHHLAIIELRTAHALEEHDDPDAAEPGWRRAWHYWLLHFAGTTDESGRALLFDHLLGIHRKHINALLAREAVDAARRHWNLVQELPGRGAVLDEEMGQDLAERVLQFKDKLATEHLLTTREAMRYGAVPEGWQADYEKGLSYLRRLLSLDRENLRLLTALVEICGEWFLDLYRTQAMQALAEQVERFTPFALQLLRLVEERPAEVAARAVLSDFYKFRGFVQRSKEEKLALYREALRLNPGNNNVRDLLAEVEGAAKPTTEEMEVLPPPSPAEPDATNEEQSDGDEPV